MPVHRDNPAPEKNTNNAGHGCQSQEDSKAASIVYWHQLEPMTKTVMDNLGPEQIPRSAIGILRDVVYLRKMSLELSEEAACKCNRPHREVPKHKSSSYGHVVTVLEKILHQFEAVLSKVSSPTAVDTHKDGQFSMDDINNMFEYLKDEELHGEEKGLYETSDTETVATNGVKKFQKKGSKKQKQKHPKEPCAQKSTTNSKKNSWVDTLQWTDNEGERGGIDYYLLIICFFRDFDSVRTYVDDRWTEYFYHKTVSLDTLAVVTNAACEIFNEMESDLQKTLKNEDPWLAEYDFMWERLFDFCLQFAHFGKDRRSVNDKDYKILREVDRLGFFTYANVTRMLKFIVPGKVPMLPSSSEKTPKYGILGMGEYRNFTTDALFHLLPEINTLNDMKKYRELPTIACAQDELTLDFEKVFQNRSCPSATVFSLSLYIDIRYILEDKVVDAFDLVQATAARTKSILENQLPNIRGWDLKEEFRRRLDEIEVFIMRDIFAGPGAMKLEDGIEEDFEKHLLLKKDPIWSGLLDLRCRLVLNNLGYHFINDSAVVLGAAFIYAASRVREESGLHWPQMERVFRAHGEYRILRGSIRPYSTPRGVLKRWVIHDLSTTDPPSNSRFPPTSKSFEALRRRYTSEKTRSRQPPAYLGEIIRDRFDTKAVNMLSKQATKLPWGARDSENPRSVRDTMLGNSALDDATIQKPLQEVSQVQLLEILDETTTSVLENQLSIDYFGLYQESLQLLRGLIHEFSSEVKKDAPFLLDVNTEVDQFPQLLPIVYRSIADGDADAAQITERLRKVLVKLETDV